MYQAETLYTYDVAGKQISLHKDLSVLQREMLNISPEDKKEILALTDAVKIVQGICGIAGKDHNRRSGAFEKLYTTPKLLRYCRISTEELSERFSHPLLRRFIRCFLGRHFSALALLVVFATFCGENGGLPHGGSLAMAKRMAERFVELGGELLLQKDAVKINVDGDRATSVVFADGSTVSADYVICTADAKVTFDKLLSRPLPKVLQKQYADEKMIRFSSYHSAFSCPAEVLPFSGDLIFQLPPKMKRLLGTEYLILREFSHEPSFAPEGQTVLQTLTFCREEISDEFIRMHANKIAYKQKKQELAEILENAIVDKFPQLKGKIRCLDVWTPATYQRYLLSDMGAYMGFIFPKNRLPKRVSCRIRGLKNVVLATQWQQAPGGLPTAAGMGKRAIECINRMEKRMHIFWKLPLLKVKRVRKA